MTTEHEASRTLVKSPPELWAECSDASSLARHLGEFGEITITRLEPESTVAWEGERVSGTVRIEPSAWGTRVTLTAQTAGTQPREADLIAEPEPPADDEIQAGLDPVRVEPRIEKENGDATVEETAEDQVELAVADTGRARARWRRIIAGVRRGLGFAEPAEKLDDADSAKREGSLEPGETVGSAPPPLLHAAAPAAAHTPPEGPAELEPGPTPERLTEPVAEPAPTEPELDAEAILTGALDSLGQAHHRPFSRA